MDRGGELIVEDNTKEVCETGEVGMKKLSGVCVFMSVKSESTPNVN